MTRDDLLPSLFASCDEIAVEDAIVTGYATAGGTRVAVVGITGGAPLGIDGAIRMAAHVTRVIESGETLPIVVLVDTASQRMRRRDEMLGLSEYLGHLAKSLLCAAQLGHPTIGILYGSAAAGAFIATALSTRHLVALDGAEPSVMDLPSIARVTKQPLEKLEAMAKDTPVFAPGLDHLDATGAIQERWDGRRPLGEQLEATLSRFEDRPDGRDRHGAKTGGRRLAAEIAARTMDEILRA